MQTYWSKLHTCCLYYDDISQLNVVQWGASRGITRPTCCTFYPAWLRLLMTIKSAFASLSLCPAHCDGEYVCFMELICRVCIGTKAGLFAWQPAWNVYIQSCTGVCVRNRQQDKEMSEVNKFQSNNTMFFILGMVNWEETPSPHLARMGPPIRSHTAWLGKGKVLASLLSVLQLLRWSDYKTKQTDEWMDVFVLAHSRALTDNSSGAK